MKSWHLRYWIPCHARHLLGWMRFAPKKSTLQAAISKIKDSPWERIHRALLNHAKEQGLEKGDQLRIDSTVTETHIHEPTDSSLLWDSVRILIRLLEQAEEMGINVEWRNHRRVVKKRARAIIYRRGQDRKKALYRDLVHYTEKTVQYIKHAKIVGQAHHPDMVRA